MIHIMLMRAMEREKHRGEDRRHEHSRGLLPDPVMEEDHALTDYPCRTPNGKKGRVAVIMKDGEWVLVCRVSHVGT
jgi:hypothetical protein